MSFPSDPEDVFGSFVLSSDALPVVERFSRWREELMARVLRVDVDVPDRDDFRAELHVLTLPRIGIIDRHSTPSQVVRDRFLIRDGADDLVFSFGWEGVSEWRTSAGETRLSPGQAIVTALNEVGGFRSPGRSSAVSIRMGRAQAARALPSIESRFGRPVAVPRTAKAILSAYLDALRGEPDLAPPIALLVEHQIEELLAHIFDPVGDLARAEAHGGVRAARRRAALADVAANLTSPHLNAATVARRIGVSERYLQRLMEEAGASLSALIREERLKLAFRLLREPRSMGRNINEIAHSVGFNDLSHFNRSFVRRFGMTPRDARGAGKPRA